MVVYPSRYQFDAPEKEERKVNTRIRKVFVVAIVLAVLVTSCAPSPTPVPAFVKRKVALMVPGLITDKSWCQFGYEGLVRARDECYVDIAVSENVSQDEHDETIRGYIAEGFDMIIGHGGEYEESLITLAKEFRMSRSAIRMGTQVAPPTWPSTTSAPTRGPIWRESWLA